MKRVLAYQFKNNPSLMDLENISDWMIEENKTGNMKSISESFCNNALFVLKFEVEIVAFCSFKLISNYCNVNIIEVRENYRGQYLGSYLFELVEKHLKMNGIKLVKIFVHPRSAKQFWLKNGFVKAVDSIDEYRLDMEKHLI